MDIALLIIAVIMIINYFFGSSSFGGEVGA
jgi:hypothetical protein